MKGANSAWAVGLAVVAVAATDCSKDAPPTTPPGAPLKRSGDEIVVCGQLFHAGTPVVLWLDAGGYDAYRPYRSSNPDALLPSRPAPGCNTPHRYDAMRDDLDDSLARQIRRNGWDLAALQRAVDLFVIHYDAVGLSRECFRVLHDERGLSVHFLLDLDGTIYQTMDLKERARHAGAANSRSVGVEIAHIGAHEESEHAGEWYVADGNGPPRIVIPAKLGDGGLRTRDFVARPARPHLIEGRIQRRDLHQYDYTDAQYQALIKLTATLCRVLPRIRNDYPRDERGAVFPDVLSAEASAQFSGLLGHYHVSANKVDPGPAFDWARLVKGVAALEGGP